MSGIETRVASRASVIKPEDPIRKMRSASCRPYLFEPQLKLSFMWPKAARVLVKIQVRGDLASN